MYGDVATKLVILNQNVMFPNPYQMVLCLNTLTHIWIWICANFGALLLIGKWTNSVQEQPEPKHKMPTFILLFIVVAERAQPSATQEINA